MVGLSGGVLAQYQQSADAGKMCIRDSFNTRYTPFTQGLFNVSSAIFFLSVMAVFVFLTARKVESRRWS